MIIPGVVFILLYFQWWRLHARAISIETPHRPHRPHWMHWG